MASNISVWPWIVEEPNFAGTLASLSTIANSLSQKQIGNRLPFTVSAKVWQTEYPSLCC